MFGQQSPFALLDPAYGYFTQPQPQQPQQPSAPEPVPGWAQFRQEAAAAQPQPAARPPQRRSQPISFTPQAAQPLSNDPTVAVPYRDAQGVQRMGQTTMQTAPPQTTAQLRPPTFTERLGTWSESPLLQMGLSLLGNAQNGGDWGAVGQDLRQFGQDRTQRQRQANEDRRLAAQDRRDETVFGRQQSMWGLEDQQLADWQAAIQREQDPIRQAELRAMGQDGYGDAINARDQRSFMASQSQLDRENNLRSAGIAASARERPRPLTPQFRTEIRSNFETAYQLRETYNDFVEMVRNADTATLMGVGPAGARLAAQQRLLSIQAKSPAALDLGALVGADFAILDDIIGNPQNWRQLVQSGGRDGIIERLSPFDTFMNRGVSRLRGTYQDYAEEFPEYYQPQTLPREATPSAPTPGQPSAPRPVAAPRGGPPPEARRQGFTHWNGTMWVRPPSGGAGRTSFDRNNPSGAY
jgi:hypothetical protein